MLHSPASRSYRKVEEFVTTQTTLSYFKRFVKGKEIKAKLAEVERNLQVTLTTFGVRLLLILRQRGGVLTSWDSAEHVRWVQCQ